MTETASGRVAELTDATFDAALAAPLPLLVAFSDAVCAPCLAMERQLAPLAAEYAGRVRVAKVGAPRHPAVTARYGVLGLPTFVLFRDGREVARLPGTPPKAALRRLLDDALAAPAALPPAPYDAATLATLVRRWAVDPDDLAFYVAFGPEDTPEEELVRVCGRRWEVEEGFAQAKGEVGLDQYEVRTWTAWHRFVTLESATLFVAG